ncbi:hypothetical protein BCR42DRAFT_425273 [Absidia repens]|uniref:Uncharacterized protein n=1 Tax=Absidia repens TaxID=90262 RepID=A0A1X2I2Z6_9FUNG|nr:hypothetical protein BCR42DRAFT_425273 [Absidia repens]
MKTKSLLGLTSNAFLPPSLWLVTTATTFGTNSKIYVKKTAPSTNLASSSANSSLCWGSRMINRSVDTWNQPCIPNWL